MPGVGNDLETVEFIIWKLLGVGRAREAASLAAYRGKDLPSAIVVEILTEAAREQVREGSASNDHSMFLFSPWKNCFSVYGTRQNDIAGRSALARLEWAYLAMLEHSRRPPVVLHKTMSTSPEFFVKVLRSIYRPAPDSGIEEVVEDTKQARSLAGHAYGLLRSWHKVPGEIDGIVDSAVLQEWVDRVRAGCAEVGRGDIGDQHIGNVLASAPADPDGVWPMKAVRELIERTPSRHIETGVMLGIHNNRGGTWRGMTNGGAQERSIAGRYHEYARATELEWPRTAALLEQIARSYEEEGQRHDQSAERTDWSL